MLAVTRRNMVATARIENDSWLLSHVVINSEPLLATFFSLFSFLTGSVPFSLGAMRNASTCPAPISHISDILRELVSQGRVISSERRSKEHCRADFLDRALLRERCAIINIRAAVEFPPRRGDLPSLCEQIHADYAYYYLAIRNSLETLP